MNGGIQNFTMEDVARLCNLQILKTTRNNTFCVCPFCGDKRNKFSYNPGKNYYHCWNCGEGGKGLQLYMKLSTKNYDDYKDAVRDIFEAINGNTELSMIHRESIDSLKISEATPKASDDTIDAVYREMLNMLPLRKEHKEHLMSSKRGLTANQIEYFKFRSTPTDTEGICRKLRSKGYSVEGVPGFYFDEKKNEWSLHISAQGILCPVYDKERNLILGFQIMLDKPFKKTKYVWLSSSEKNKGCGPGALTTCFIGSKYPNCILIIEGILKSTIVWTLLKGQVTVMGVPGTKCLNTLLPYLQRFEYGYVFECFDMDKCTSKDETDPKTIEKAANISKEAAALRELIADNTSLDLRENGLFWDYEDVIENGKTVRHWKGEYKGLDDFLLSYNDKEMFINYLWSIAGPSIKTQKYIAS